MMVFKNIFFAKYGKGVNSLWKIRLLTVGWSLYQLYKII